LLSTTTLYSALNGSRTNFAAKFIERFYEPLRVFLRACHPEVGEQSSEDLVSEFLTRQYESMLPGGDGRSVIDVYFKTLEDGPTTQGFSAFVFRSLLNFVYDDMSQHANRNRLQQTRVSAATARLASLNANRELARRALEEFRRQVCQKIQETCRDPALVRQLLDLRWPPGLETSPISQTEAGHQLGVSEARLRTVRDALIHAIALTLRDDVIAQRDPSQGNDIPDVEAQRRARTVWQTLARSCVESLAVEMEQAGSDETLSETTPKGV
jgi:hypothetical protein